MEKRRKDQAEIDHILEKISQQGILSLSSKEKKILQNATESQRKQEQDIGRL